MQRARLPKPPPIAHQRAITIDRHLPLGLPSLQAARLQGNPYHLAFILTTLLVSTSCC